MKEFDIEFEVNQKTLYSMTVEAETPEQAIEIAKHEDFDRHEAEEDCLLESYDDVDTIKVVGERVKDHISSHQKPFNPPITQKPTPFEKYKRTHGNRCPVCQGQHITANSPFNADNLDAWRDVECEECEATWREMFTMQNIDIL